MSIRLWLARLLAPRVFYEHATMRDVLRDLVAARDRVYSCPHKELEAEAETTAYRNAWNAVVYTIKTLL